MRVKGPVGGVVALRFAGTTDQHMNFMDDGLVFTFQPVETARRFKRDPILTTGRLVVNVGKKSLLSQPSLMIYRDESYFGVETVGPLFSPIDLTNHSTRVASNYERDHLIKALRDLRERGGYRCLSQSEYLVDAFSPVSVTLPNGYGHQLFLFYSPDDLSDIVVHGEGRYIPQSVSGYLALSDRYFRSAATGGRVTVEFFPEESEYELGAPRRLKVLVLNSAFGSYSKRRPCDLDFRTPIFDAKWVALGNIALALLENKIAGVQVFDDPLLNFALSTTLISDRNERLGGALATLLPELSDGELGIIASALTSLARDGLGSVPESVAVELIYQELKEYGLRGSALDASYVLYEALRLQQEKGRSLVIQE